MLISIIPFFLAIGCIQLLILKERLLSDFSFLNAMSLKNIYANIRRKYPVLEISKKVKSPNNIGVELEKITNDVSAKCFVNSALLKSRTELNLHLKHLQFILDLEYQIENIASKDNISLERLEDFMVLKKEVQLKIIKLSKNI